MHSKEPKMPKIFRGLRPGPLPQLPRCAGAHLTPAPLPNLAVLRAALRKSKMQIYFGWMQIKQIYSHALSSIQDKQYSLVLYTWQAISPCPVYRTSNISLSCIQDKQFLPIVVSCIQDKHHFPVVSCIQLYRTNNILYIYIYTCPVYMTSNISMPCIQDK